MKHIPFFILVVTLLFLIITPVNAAIDANIKYYLTFNGTNGGTSFPDSSNSGNHYTVAISKANTSTADKKFGTASLVVNNVAVGDATRNVSQDWNTGTGSWSISFWMKETSPRVNYGTPFAMSTGGTYVTNKIKIEFRTTGSIVRVQTPGPVDTDLTLYRALDVWNYYVLTKSGSLYSLYVNGTQIGSSWSDAAAVTTPYIQLGGDGSYWFKGYIDEFKYYNNSVIDGSVVPTSEEFTDTTPPDSITGLTDSKINCTAIQWNWTNPTTSDFNYTYVLKNNAFIANYSNSTIGVVWDGLTASTSYTFSSRTVDFVGNMNASYVNKTETTDACPTPTPTPTPTATEAPATDCYGVLGSCDSIRWRLANPTDSTFNGTMVYRNNTYLYNLTNASTYETWTGLYQGIEYTISTRAFYFNTSVNNTWKNATSHTALCDCLLCGLVTTRTTQTPGIPNLPAVYDNQWWLPELVMKNAWWLILLLGLLLVLKRK